MSTRKKTDRHGIADVPLILQMESAECGAACLAMILGYHDKWVPISDIREKCGVTTGGSTALRMLQASRYYGLEGKGLYYSADGLRENKVWPCICCWDGYHYVVLKGFYGDKVYLNDPDLGDVVLSFDEFAAHYTGICLVVKPGEDFQPGGERLTVLDYIRDTLRGLWPLLLLFILFSAIGVGTAVLDTRLLNLYVDDALQPKSTYTMLILVVVMATILIIRLITGLTQNMVWPKIQRGFSGFDGSGQMWELLHKPYSFFCQRQPGYLLARVKDAGKLTERIICTIVPVLLNGITGIIYLVIIVRYSKVFALSTLLVGLSGIVFSSLIGKKRENLMNLRQRDEGALLSSTVMGIELIDTLKSNGAEDTYFQRWAGYQAVNHNNIFQEQLYSVLLHENSNADKLFCYIVNLTIGGMLYFNGSVTTGELIAVLSLGSLFLSNLEDTIAAIRSIMELNVQIERQRDVQDYPEDVEFQNEFSESSEDEPLLSGSVELRDVSFGYDCLEAPFIEHLNLTIQPGQMIALTGPSACGKTTLLRLLEGICQPWSGEILFDGKPRTEIDKHVLSASIGVVDQELQFFTGSIANNMRMWDLSVPYSTLEQSASKAGIHDAIIAKPGGYDALLSPKSGTFSDGQLQCLEIARVLAQNASILLLDEATSNMDLNMEMQILKMLKKEHITVILATHSTLPLADFDEILVMNQGKITECGTCQELVALGGEFARMMEG